VQPDWYCRRSGKSRRSRPLHRSTLPRLYRGHGRSGNLVHNAANVNKTHGYLHSVHVYRLRTLTESPPKHRKTNTKLKRITPKSWQIMTRPSPQSTESTRPTEKAWCHTIRHGAPLQLLVFLVCYNAFSLALSESYVLHGFLSPALLLQCISTGKTCHALSSSGVLLLLLLLLLLLHMNLWEANFPVICW
jgi:hypothetical protein